MLTKDLLRVSRAGGTYRPRFTEPGDERLADLVLGVYQGHVGERRDRLEDALADLEGGADDFKLVRGFAKLLERDATFETRAAVPPERARRAAFEAAEAVGVVATAERERALALAAEELGVDAAGDAAVDAVERSLYADRDARQVLVAFDPRWSPAALCEQYDLSLAQTALFDATEVRVRSSDPKAVVSAVKRLRLMYEIRRSGRRSDTGTRSPDGSDPADLDAEDDDDDAALPDREVVVTGPSGLFSGTHRYGTRFARLLRTVAGTPRWRLEADIDDRGTERRLTLTDDDVSVPGVEPLTEPTYDSGVEADFAARFEALDLDWTLTREPEPLAAGAHVVIPDFSFEWRHGSFRVFFEIVGFWTPEYVAKKCSRLADLEDVDLVVAVDESLGVTGDLADLGHRVVPYRGTVSVRDVRNALRPYEEHLVAESAAALPDELVPDADVTTLAAVAADYGVSESVVEAKLFPEHDRVGRTLVRRGVLDDLAERIEPGTSLADAESELAAAGIDDASAALSALGFRVEWDGLSGGTVREKSAGDG